MKNKFITFEGIEGSGKSTQAKLLYRYLRNKGYPVVYLREPGAATLSEKIRKILLNPKNKSLSSLSETLLYMIARAQTVKEVILPALKKDKVVICDRFLDSTFAYQGYGLGVNINFIQTLADKVTQGIKPALTIFLDLPVKEGLRRCGRIKDRIEKRPLSYHLRVRKGYLNLANSNPKRIKVIKVNRDINTTQKKIRNLVINFLNSCK